MVKKQEERRSGKNARGERRGGREIGSVFPTSCTNLKLTFFVKLSTGRRQRELSKHAQASHSPKGSRVISRTCCVLLSNHFSCLITGLPRAGAILITK